MSIGAPRYGILGTQHSEAAQAFLALFDLQPVGELHLPTEIAHVLYGLDGDMSITSFETPGVPGRGVRLVPTSHVRPSLAPDAVCGYAIDIYTRDMTTSLHTITSAGYTASSTAMYNLGSVTFAETRIFGPDDINVVLIETAARRPSRLDSEHDAMYSEVQAFVFCVADAAPDMPFWTSIAKLDLMRSERIPMGEPLGSMMELPPDTHLGLDLFWNESSASARVEVLSFPGRDSRGAMNVHPLYTGLNAIAFTIPAQNAEETLAAIKDIPLHGSIKLPSGRSIYTGRSPAGIPFELWSEE